MNNPLIVALAGAGVRWVITFAAARGVAISDDAATQGVYGAIALGTLIWSFAHKKKVDTDVKNAKAGL